MVDRQKLISVIKQLPSVLQTEIWDYVCGDRKYWTSKFEQVLHHLDGLIWSVQYLNGVTSVPQSILVEKELVRLTPNVLEHVIVRGKEAREQRNWLRANDRDINPTTKSDLADNDLAWWCSNHEKFPIIFDS